MTGNALISYNLDRSIDWVSVFWTKQTVTTECIDTNPQFSVNVRHRKKNKTVQTCTRQSRNGKSKSIDHEAVNREAHKKNRQTYCLCFHAKVFVRYSFRIWCSSGAAWLIAWRQNDDDSVCAPVVADGDAIEWRNWRHLCTPLGNIEYTVQTLHWALLLLSRMKSLPISQDKVS